MMFITYMIKANTDKVMHIIYEAKENHSRQRNCLLNITYYKLRAKKHFGYYIIDLRNKGYRVGGAEEILN